jgi:transposase
LTKELKRLYNWFNKTLRAKPMKKEQAKIYEAQRPVINLEVVDWSRLVDEQHPARRIIGVLDKMDLSELYSQIASQKSCKGRPAIDPKIMVAILVYAAMKGMSSSRMIAQHCKWEPGFRWILGHNLTVKHVTISTFRQEAGNYLETLLTQVVTTMVAVGIVDLDEVILDGSKIKANAGRGSFHTQQELQALHKEIPDKMEKMGLEEKQKTEKAALKNRQDRIQKALEQIPDIQQTLQEAAKKKKKGASVADAKASITDADARQMRFADGARGPGYNPQFMTASKSGVIVDVKVTQRRNDFNMMTPLLESFKTRYGRLPKRILADTGYSAQGDIINVLERGVEVYCPQVKGRKESKEESRRRLEKKRSKEPEKLQVWRGRMETPEAKAIRRSRLQTEKVHGWIKSNMTHSQFKLRGVLGVQIEMVLYSIGYNLRRYFNMVPV